MGKVIAKVLPLREMKWISNSLEEVHQQASVGRYEDGLVGVD